MQIEDWLERLAAKQPTPGGGAAAALAAAGAAALVGMVSIYTTGNKWADREATMQLVHDQAAKLRTEALQLMADDEAAFAKVGAAYGLPKENDGQKAERQHAIQTALAAAAEPPRHVALVASDLVSLAKDLTDKGNPNVISDVAVAVSFARAAIESAIVNIEINQQLLTDAQLKADLQLAVTAAEADMQRADAITAAVRQRIRGDG